MNVKFINTDVPIWKVRIGTVVRWQSGDHEYFAHIKAFTVSNAGDVLIALSVGFTDIVYVKPGNITWLEPF